MKSEIKVVLLRQKLSFGSKILTNHMLLLLLFEALYLYKNIEKYV